MLNKALLETHTSVISLAASTGRAAKGWEPAAAGGPPSLLPPTWLRSGFGFSSRGS